MWKQKKLENGYYQYVDENDNVLEDREYAYCTTDFNFGLALVQYADTYRYEIINKDGDHILADRCDDTNPTRSNQFGECRNIIGYNDRITHIKTYGMTDTNGHMVVPFVFTDISWYWDMYTIKNDKVDSQIIKTYAIDPYGFVCIFQRHPS